MMNKKFFYLAFAGILAAMYIVLALLFAPISFGIVQFRLAEVLTILPVVTNAAIPGVFIGCFLANFLNPQNLGLIDILGGSFTTLVAAWLTCYLAKGSRLFYRQRKEHGKIIKKQNLMLFSACLPPVLLNGLIVGFYLPFLLTDHPELPTVLLSMLSVFLSQAIVVYGLGMPFLLVLINNEGIRRYLEKTHQSCRN